MAKNLALAGSHPKTAGEKTANEKLMTLEGAIPKLQVKNLWVENIQFKRRHRKTQLKNLWVKSIQFRRRHPKIAGEKSRHKVPSQNCR